MWLVFGIGKDLYCHVPSVSFLCKRCPLLLSISHHCVMRFSREGQRTWIFSSQVSSLKKATPKPPHLHPQLNQTVKFWTLSCCYSGWDFRRFRGGDQRILPEGKIQIIYGRKVDWGWWKIKDGFSVHHMETWESISPPLESGLALWLVLTNKMQLEGTLCQVLQDCATFIFALLELQATWKGVQVPRWRAERFLVKDSWLKENSF